MPALQTTQSTHPSTSASSDSIDAMASRCSGVSGIPTLVRLTALEMESGSRLSASRSCSSIASRSMEMPRAYLPISASKRGISHGTAENRRACAASRRARNVITSSCGIGSGWTISLNSASVCASIALCCSPADASASALSVFASAAVSSSEMLPKESSTLLFNDAAYSSMFCAISAPAGLDSSAMP